MRHWIVSLVFLLTLAAPAAADYFAELDGDGVLGNGPDYLNLSPWDSFTVDLWIVGDGDPICAFDLAICNFDDGLEFVSATESLPDDWILQSPTPGECVHMAGCWSPYTSTEGATWGSVKSLFRTGGGAHKRTTTGPLSVPIHVGTMTYRIVYPDGVSDLVLDTSLVFDEAYEATHLSNEWMLLLAVEYIDWP